VPIKLQLEKPSKNKEDILDPINEKIKKNNPFLTKSINFTKVPASERYNDTFQIYRKANIEFLKLTQKAE